MSWNDQDFWSDDPWVRFNAHQEAKGRRPLPDPDEVRKAQKEGRFECVGRRVGRVGGRGWVGVTDRKTDSFYQQCRCVSVRERWVRNPIIDLYGRCIVCRRSLYVTNAARLQAEEAKAA